MVVKKRVKRTKVKKVSKKKSVKKRSKSKRPKINLEKVPTLKLKTESEIAMDFATKVYRKFDKIIKSVVLFGSLARNSPSSGSDIDIIILLDDVSINWDQKLIAWYREEVEKLIKNNPYKEDLHINTIKLSTWWEDLLRGDPIVINIIRDGKPLIDFGGFFEPLQYLLAKGKIKSTPEAIYSLLQRAPAHISRSKVSELNCIEGLFWAMVDSAHAALIASNVTPTSPEHLPMDLKENFVNPGKLKSKYVLWYRDLLILHKRIAHGHITDLKGVEIDMWQERTEQFLKEMVTIVKNIVG